MHTRTTYTVKADIEAIAGQYGQPVIVNETLRIKTMFGAIDERPARIAEIVPVIQRPGGILTMIKDNYPAGMYRLPSGGIHKGEPILEGLRREVYEETGLTVNVSRFLAIIRYQIIVAGGRTGRFTSYAFLVEGDGPIQPMDMSERIAGFREVQPLELRSMAEALYNLHADEDNDWNDWGRFRSVVHRVVADILSPQ
jgi:8-oxo-dGTP pyrophosphatase MutT (NUDIX family)